MPKEETRLQVLAFTDLKGTPNAGVDLVTLRAGTIVWDAMVIVTGKDAAGRTIDLDVVDADGTTTLVNDLDTSPATVPAHAASSKQAAAPPVPRYLPKDAVLKADPSAATDDTFIYTVVVTISSLLG